MVKEPNWEEYEKRIEMAKRHLKFATERFEALKNDPEFMKQYNEGVKAIAKAEQDVIDVHKAEQDTRTRLLLDLGLMVSREFEEPGGRKWKKLVPSPELLKAVEQAAGVTDRETEDFCSSYSKWYLPYHRHHVEEGNDGYAVWQTAETIARITVEEHPDSRKAVQNSQDAYKRKEEVYKQWYGGYSFDHYKPVTKYQWAKDEVERAKQSIKNREMALSQAQDDFEKKKQEEAQLAEQRKKLEERMAADEKLKKEVEEEELYEKRMRKGRKVLLDLTAGRKKIDWPPKK